MRRKRQGSSDSGLTTVELLIVLAVGAVLVGFGLPSLHELALEQLVRDTATQLQLDATYARSEAITRGNSVSLCTSNTGTACTRTGWQDGWITFIDSDGNGVLDGANTILRVTHNPAVGVVVSSATAQHAITINDRGGAAAKVVLRVCMSGLKGRDLTIRLSGYPLITVPSGLCSSQG